MKLFRRLSKAGKGKQKKRRRRQHRKKYAKHSQRY
jgi:hypothetical protein